MAAIPGKEVIGCHDGGNGQMRRVASGFGWQTAYGDKKAGQFLGVSVDGRVEASPESLTVAGPVPGRLDWLR